MRSITNLKHPPRFALASHEGNRIVLASPANCRIELFVLAEDIIRVLVLPDGELHGPRTWAIAPGAEDVALEGRERLAALFSHRHLRAGLRLCGEPD